LEKKGDGGLLLLPCHGRNARQQVIQHLTTRRFVMSSNTSCALDQNYRQSWSHSHRSTPLWLYCIGDQSNFDNLWNPSLLLSCPGCTSVNSTGRECHVECGSRECTLGPPLHRQFDQNVARHDANVIPSAMLLPSGPKTHLPGRRGRILATHRAKVMGVLWAPTWNESVGRPLRPRRQADRPGITIKWSRCSQL